MKTLNLSKMGQAELANLYAAQSQKIRTAETLGRSASTINRLWRQYFKIEDALKGFSGSF